MIQLIYTCMIWLIYNMIQLVNPIQLIYIYIYDPANIYLIWLIYVYQQLTNLMLYMIQLVFINSGNTYINICNRYYVIRLTLWLNW